jgi:glucose-6-phosphate isomerase
MAVTFKSLTEAGAYGKLSVLVDKLTSRIMGALLAIYEAKIVFQGFVWNNNSFDQEGVQLGKVLATRFLQAINVGSKSAETLEGAFLNQL